MNTKNKLFALCAGVKFGFLVDDNRMVYFFYEDTFEE